MHSFFTDLSMACWDLAFPTNNDRREDTETDEDIREEAELATDGEAATGGVVDAFDELVAGVVVGGVVGAFDELVAGLAAGRAKFWLFLASNLNWIAYLPSA